ncbi:unnamed protein product [Amoebophrya sp. A120]|nr:unnamed protein product [Amoebophrya sp. A120]|eukprot:GSA120T00010289001.1
MPPRRASPVQSPARSPVRRTPAGRKANRSKSPTPAPSKRGSKDNAASAARSAKRQRKVTFDEGEEVDAQADVPASSCKGRNTSANKRDKEKDNPTSASPVHLDDISGDKRLSKSSAGKNSKKESPVFGGDRKQVHASPPPSASPLRLMPVIKGDSSYAADHALGGMKMQSVFDLDEEDDVGAGGPAGKKAATSSSKDPFASFEDAVENVAKPLKMNRAIASASSQPATSSSSTNNHAKPLNKPSSSQQLQRQDSTLGGAKTNAFNLSSLKTPDGQRRRQDLDRTENRNRAVEKTENTMEKVMKILLGEQEGTPGAWSSSLCSTTLDQNSRPIFSSTAARSRGKRVFDHEEVSTMIKEALQVGFAVVTDPHGSSEPGTSERRKTTSRKRTARRPAGLNYRVLERETEVAQLNDWYSLQDRALATTPLFIRGGQQQGKTKFVCDFFKTVRKVYKAEVVGGDLQNSSATSSKPQQKPSFKLEVLHVVKPMIPLLCPAFASSSAPVGVVSDFASEEAHTSSVPLKQSFQPLSFAELHKRALRKTTPGEIEIAAIGHEIERVLQKEERLEEETIFFSATGGRSAASAANNATEAGRLSQMLLNDKQPIAGAVENSTSAAKTLQGAPSTTAATPFQQLPPMNANRIFEMLRVASKKAAKTFGSWLEHPMVLILDDLLESPTKISNRSASNALTANSRGFETESEQAAKILTEFVSELVKQYGNIVRVIWINPPSCALNCSQSTLPIFADTITLKNFTLEHLVAMFSREVLASGILEELQAMLKNKTSSNCNSNSKANPSAISSVATTQMSSSAASIPETGKAVVKQFLHVLNVKNELFDHQLQCQLLTNKFLANCMEAFRCYCFDYQAQLKQTKETALEWQCLVNYVLKKRAPLPRPRADLQLRHINGTVATTAKELDGARASSDMTGSFSPCVNLAIVAAFLAQYNPKDADRVLLMGDCNDKWSNKKIPNKAFQDCGLFLGKLRAPVEERQGKSNSVMRVRAVFEILQDKFFPRLKCVEGQSLFTAGCSGVDIAGGNGVGHGQGQTFWFDALNCLTRELKLWSVNPVTQLVTSHLQEEDVYKALEKLGQDPAKFLQDYLLQS